MQNVKREINVKEQESLPLEKSMRFCLKGINYRLFRSSLTLACYCYGGGIFYGFAFRKCVT